MAFTAKQTTHLLSHRPAYTHTNLASGINLEPYQINMAEDSYTHKRQQKKGFRLHLNNPTWSKNKTGAPVSGCQAVVGPYKHAQVTGVCHCNSGQTYFKVNVRNFISFLPLVASMDVINL